jgi:hypothetical protein
MLTYTFFLYVLSSLIDGVGRIGEPAHEHIWWKIKQNNQTTIGLCYIIPEEKQAKNHCVKTERLRARRPQSDERPSARADLAVSHGRFAFSPSSFLFFFLIRTTGFKLVYSVPFARTRNPNDTVFRHSRGIITAAAARTHIIRIFHSEIK